MIVIKGNTITIDNGTATLEDKNEFSIKLDLMVNSGHKEINIDMGMTSFLPSEMMDLLMWSKRDLEKKNISFKIVRISSSLKSLFDTTQLSRYFDIDDAEITDFPY
jgi:anti-anti-sigma regulatory factor